MKTVILLRATSGAGKSKFADFLKGLIDDYAVICCADDFFLDKEGNYNFDSSKLYCAHNQCQKTFKNALIHNTELVIVANTNTKQSDFKYYIDLAKEYRYTLFSLVVENRHGGSNRHNVPELMLLRQEQNIKKSLKLNA